MHSQREDLSKATLKQTKSYVSVYNKVHKSASLKLSMSISDYHQLKQVGKS